MFSHILLCTHGTPGARHAERHVFEALLPAHPGTKVTVLTVVNQDWSLMTGDDWLNASATRNAFRHHVDHQLASEIETDWQRIRETFPAARECTFKRVFGPVEETFAEAAEAFDCDLIVIGPYQKKQGAGFKSRVDNKRLHPILAVPLMIAPEARHGKSD